MAKRIIKVPTGIQYLSQVEEIKNEFNNDLPHNVIINKQVTGCGGTSLALMNSEKYVVAVHLIEMIKCKVDQDDRYPNVLGVYSKTSDEEIIEYVQNGGKKIMVTYDSIPRLKRLLGTSLKHFRLLVDEFHKLIAYLGEFKPLVAVKLLDQNDDFKSVSYLTATPTEYKYLPEPMKKLDIIEFDWEAKIDPHIEHAFVKDTMGNRVLATILNHLDKTDNELYIFYNSRVSVTGIIKKLLICKPEMKLTDIGIMFARTVENKKYFKRHLGPKFEFTNAPDGEHNKRITFISSMGFEGLDFYPNHITNVEPISIVVSDPKLKSMRFDINVEIVQILGRFRKHKKSDLFVENKMIYLWNTRNTEFSRSESDFYKHVESEKESAIKHLDAIDDNEGAKKFIAKALTNNQHDHMILDNKTAIIHPYSIEAQMSAYIAVHSQSSILGNLDENGDVKKDSSVVLNLANLDPNVSTFELPDIDSKYKKLLGRNPSVNDLIVEYNNLEDELSMSLSDPIEQQNAEDNIAEFLQHNQEFNEWIQAGITTSRMRTLQYNRKKITEEAHNLRTICDNENYILNHLDFEVDTIYTRDEIVSKINIAYKSLGITDKKIKATEIKKWYKIKPFSKTVEGKSFSAYKIVSKL